ncbi:MAG: mechanosensitive ion channel domain-containing protein [Thermodesulfobacteriota bacterium]
MSALFESAWSWIVLNALRLPAALLILVAGLWISRRLSRLLAKVLEKAHLDPVLIQFLKSVTYYVLAAVVCVAAIGQLGVSTASLLTVLGAAGLAVGLALKDSLSSIAAGVMLMVLRPFTVGDFVTVGGQSGKVEKVTIFHTQLATPDNQRVLVPNAAILGDTVVNVTANPTRRIDLVVGISYADDTVRAKEVVSRVLAEEPRLLADPAPQVAVAELADSSVNLVVRPWVATADYWDVRFSLTEAIKRALDQAGVSIPFPQRDVHLHTVKA